MGITLIQQHFHIGLLYIHVYLLVFGSPVYAAGCVYGHGCL